MDMKSVRSSRLSEVGYDPQSRLMRVRFRDGRVYEYDDVDEGMHRDLMSADSHGRYFGQTFRFHDKQKTRRVL